MNDFDAITPHLRTDAPDLVRHLAVVLRFHDVFTHAPIAFPLRVTIPELELVAHRCERDATYRFSVIGELPSPAATYDVEVEVPGDLYVPPGPVQVDIPRPTLPHPPPLLASDYLQEVPLAPTASLRPGPGETAVLGRVVDDATGAPLTAHRVFFHLGVAIPPGTPWAPTRDDGGFLYRLPGLGKSGTGLTVDTTVDLHVTVQAGGGGGRVIQSIAPGGMPGNQLPVTVGAIGPPVTIRIT